MRRKLNFGDIIGSSRPDTKEKAIERWAFLKSDHERKNNIQEIRKGIGDVLLGVLMFITMVAIGVIAILVEI